MVFSTLRKFKATPFSLLAVAIKNIDSTESHDVIDENIKTAKRFKEFKDTETGWDRIKKMFQLDEYDNISPELSTIYQAGFLGLLIGVVYGGFMGSKKSYMDFMERNQATAFETHHLAKKKLQDSVTVSFARMGWRLGWRLSVFAFMYMGTSTLISVYRNKYSITDYIAAGVVTGAAYKWNMGPRGMTAGALVGGSLGMVAGGVTVGFLKLTGTTMEEVRYWQYKWRADRLGAYKEGFEKSLENSPLSHKNIIQDLHDIKIGVTRPNLDQLSDEPPTVKKSTDTKSEKDVDKKPETVSKESSEKK